MKKYLVLSILFLFSFTHFALADCRSYSHTSRADTLLEARSLAKTYRNLKAIRDHGRRRMCGHARHTELCNRYFRHDVQCRIVTKSNLRTVYACTATGTVCSVDRGRRPLLDGPQFFPGPFIPLFNKKKKRQKRWKQ